MGVTATRSSTTEPMLVGDAFMSSCGAARGARNLISRDLSARRSDRGDWASSPDVVLSPVWVSAKASKDEGAGAGEFSSDELDDAGPTGAELPRPGARRRPVPADVLRRAAPRRDAGASPAAPEFYRAVLRTGAPDGSRVNELGVLTYKGVTPIVTVVASDVRRLLKSRWTSHRRYFPSRVSPSVSCQTSKTLWLSPAWR